MAKWVSIKEVEKSFGDTSHTCDFCDEWLDEKKRVYQDKTFCADLHPMKMDYYFCNEECHQKWLPKKEEIEKEEREKSQHYKDMTEYYRAKVYSGGLPSLGKRR